MRFPYVVCLLGLACLPAMHCKGSPVGLPFSDAGEAGSSDGVESDPGTVSGADGASPHAQEGGLATHWPLGHGGASLGTGGTTTADAFAAPDSDAGGGNTAGGGLPIAGNAPLGGNAQGGGAATGGNAFGGSGGPATGGNALGGSGAIGSGGQSGGTGGTAGATSGGGNGGLNTTDSGVAGSASGTTNNGGGAPPADAGQSNCTDNQTRGTCTTVREICMNQHWKVDPACNEQRCSLVTCGDVVGGGCCQSWGRFALNGSDFKPNESLVVSFGTTTRGCTQATFNFQHLRDVGSLALFLNTAVGWGEISKVRVLAYVTGNAYLEMTVDKRDTTLGAQTPLRAVGSNTYQTPADLNSVLSCFGPSCPSVVDLINFRLRPDIMTGYASLEVCSVQID